MLAGRHDVPAAAAVHRLPSRDDVVPSGQRDEVVEEEVGERHDVQRAGVERAQALGESPQVCHAARRAALKT
jgi:hypothetical protein